MPHLEERGIRAEKGGAWRPRVRRELSYKGMWAVKPLVLTGDAFFCVLEEIGGCCTSAPSNGSAAKSESASAVY